MRRVGKQIVAITLAAAMMGSLTPEACTFLQNEIVYAAETNEASAPTVTRTELYKNENAKTTETIDGIIICKSNFSCTIPVFFLQS